MLRPSELHTVSAAAICKVGMSSLGPPQYLAGKNWNPAGKQKPLPTVAAGGSACAEGELCLQRRRLVSGVWSLDCCVFWVSARNPQRPREQP